MSHKVKVAGTWRDASPYVKADGSWKLVDYVWNNVAGKWRTSFVKGGLTDYIFPLSDFRLGAAANGDVRSIVVQSDGKVIVGGSFSSWNNVSVGRFVRLNSDGSFDTDFVTNIGTGASGTVYSIVVQPDGKILVGGNLTSWNGVTVRRIVRLNSDGTHDTSFTTNVYLGPNNDVRSIALQQDGKIVVGGSFTTWISATVNRIVRLNSDGTHDTSFTTNTGTGANNVIYSIATQQNDKIFAAGDLTSWNGTTVGRFVCLNSDGTLDTDFVTNIGTGANGTVWQIAAQSDGKILAGGTFSNWNNQSTLRLVRLNSDGTSDTEFMTNVGSGGLVYSLAIQSDQKILVGGFFSSWSGVPVNRIMRLNQDGTPDTAFRDNVGTSADFTIYAIAPHSENTILVGGQFNTWHGVSVGRAVSINNEGIYYTGPNNNVFSIEPQSDGKILVGGEFTTWNGVSNNRIVRLNQDGNSDTDFKNNVGTGANNNVFSVALQPDGKILVAGQFTTWNSASVGYIVRLNSDGTIDNTFMTNIGTGANSTVYSVALQQDGKILVAGQFLSWNSTATGCLVRLNSDGTLDTGFMTNIGTGADAFLFTVALQSDNKIVLGGLFTSWNGTNLNSIVRLNADGTRDTVFTTNATSGTASILESIAIQADDKILVGGNFSWVGTTVQDFVCLNPDGALDATFVTNLGTGASSTVYSIAIQQGGKIIVGGQFSSWNGSSVNRIVRLNSDGTRDTDFTTNTGTGANSDVRSIVPQLDNKILVGGKFTNFNNTSPANRYFVRIGGEISA